MRAHHAVRSRALRTWSVSCAGDPLPDAIPTTAIPAPGEAHSAPDLARGGIQECESAVVDEEAHSAQSNRPDRRLVREEPLEILTGVNVARARNETP